MDSKDEYMSNQNRLLEEITRLKVVQQKLR